VNLDLTHMLQEISVAENEVEISAILERNGEALDALPPRIREQTDIFQVVDVSRARR
jgi:hypothetical protein